MPKPNSPKSRGSNNTHKKWITNSVQHNYYDLTNLVNNPYKAQNKAYNKASHNYSTYGEW